MPDGDTTESDRRKFALIIVNEKYTLKENQLNGFQEQAKQLCEKLTKIDVQVELVFDKTERDTMISVRELFKKSTKNSLVLFYYFGHGCSVEDKNYLISVNDDKIKGSLDVPDVSCELNEVFKQLPGKNGPYASIFILDCCRQYVFRDATGKGAGETVTTGLGRVNPPNQTIIQFACEPGKIVPNTLDDDLHGLYIKHLSNNITRKNTEIRDVLSIITDVVTKTTNGKQKPCTIDGLGIQEVYLNKHNSIVPCIPHDARWKAEGYPIAGGLGAGPTIDRLSRPKGLKFEEPNTILIADSLNHRILMCNPTPAVCDTVAGTGLGGYALTRLWKPSDILFDSKSRSMVIADTGNIRLLKIGRDKTKSIFKNNMKCGGLALDDEGYLYVSDIERHEVRRYGPSDNVGEVVAGGNGQGGRLHQLNHPTYVAVGMDQSVYVSDSWNDRVVKWAKNAKKGTVVAGGRGKGKRLDQLDCPTGLIVDQDDTIYVADFWNHRVLRWYKGASQGNIIVGDQYLPGDEEDRLTCPEGLAFDKIGNLYVSDCKNHRVQQYDIFNSA